MSESGGDEEEEEDEEEEVVLAPKTFGRSNRGRMIQKMISTQPAADEFWDEAAQKFFAEEDDDVGFDVEADPDAKYVDKVDSDFDENESSASSESEVEEEKQKQKQAYKDPKKKAAVAPKKAKEEPVTVKQESVTTTTTAMTPATREKRVYKKKVYAASDRSVRHSTKQRTEVANITASIAKKTRRKNAKRVVRIPTQAEILREADKTERENIASLHKIRAWEEEEKTRRKPKERVLTGPRVVFHSVGARSTVTFRDCDGVGVLAPIFARLEGRTNRSSASSLSSSTALLSSSLLSSSSSSLPLFSSPSAAASSLRLPASTSAPKRKSVPPPPPPPPMLSTTVASAPAGQKKKGTPTAGRKRDRDLDLPSPPPPMPTVATPITPGQSRSGRQIKKKRDDDFQVLE